MGMIVEFYSCDKKCVPESDEPSMVVHSIRNQGVLVSSISINSSVAADTLARLSNTALAKLVESESPTAIVIAVGDIESLLSELEKNKETDTMNNFVKAIVDAAEEIYWREQSMGIVVA